MEKKKAFAILFIIIGIFLLMSSYYSWTDGLAYASHRFPGQGERNFCPEGAFNEDINLKTLCSLLTLDIDSSAGNILQKIGLLSFGLGIFFVAGGLILLKHKT